MICLLSQFGFEVVEVVSEVRNRAGRKDAPSMSVGIWLVQERQLLAIARGWKAFAIRSS